MPVLLSVLIYSFDLFARAGGGGGSGGSGSSRVSLGVAILLFCIYHIRRRRLMNQAKRQFEKANTDDPSWNINEFRETSERIFYKYQNAWMNKDLSGLKNDFHPTYYEKATQTMNEMLNGKKNILKNIELKKINLMSVLDIKGQEGDMFVLEMDFKLIDYTIDEATQKVVESPEQRAPFESEESWGNRAKKKVNSVKEYWIFRRTNGVWLLYNIHQVERIIGNLKYASAAYLRRVLREEIQKGVHSPADDSIFYEK